MQAPLHSPTPSACPRLALFDLDHTLLQGDSDVLWCAFLMDRGVLDRAVFEPRNAALDAAYRAGTVGTREFSVGRNTYHDYVLALALD